MDNVKLIDRYLKSLEELDVLEIMEHVSTQELKAMLDREPDSNAMLRMIGAPEIENPDKLRKGKGNESVVHNKIMDHLCHFVELFGFHNSDHLLLASVLIKNNKIDTAAKMEFLADTVARVHMLDDIIYKFSLMVAIIRRKVDRHMLNEDDASLLQLLASFMMSVMTVIKVMDDSMPQWWEVDMTRLDITPAIEKYEYLVLTYVYYSISSRNKKWPKDKPYLIRFKSFDKEELKGRLMKADRVRDDHMILTRIPLPPLLIDAVKGMDKVAAKLSAASNQKLDSDLVARFRAMNNNKTIYWFTHKYQEWEL